MGVFSVSESQKAAPKPVKTRGKYKEKGMFKEYAFSAFDLPRDISDVLQKTANLALADCTKKKYDTALNCVEKCELDTKENLSFPWDNRKTLIFVGYCIKKDLKAGSIKSYLSGVSKIHLALGYQKLDLTPPILKEIFTGQENKHNQKPKKGGKGKRLPCTLKMLRLLKTEFRISDMNDKEKLIAWAGCTLAFFGALRPGEMLTKYEKSYDPALTLCKKDVSIVKGENGEKDAVHLTIKNSKSNRTGRHEIVIIYETKDILCPVRAARKVIDMNKGVSPNAPFLSGAGGKPLTLNRLNDILKEATKSVPLKGTLSGHSFRSGITSLLAKKGYSNQQLKTVGRWSSRAYQAYIKLGRSVRHEMAVACSESQK